MFHIFATLAEFKRNLILERTQAGLAAARRAGRTEGHPAKLTDEDLDVATTLPADPDITVAESRSASARPPRPSIATSPLVERTPQRI